LIADIGSGTGIFSRLLISHGLSVVAVEPNEEMRAESDRVLGESTSYRSISGTAEQTTLANHSIDFVVAAQAFHWFDVTLAKDEFRRILRPEAGVALIWNRRLSTSRFQSEYEQLLADLPGYCDIKHTRLGDDEIMQFLGDGSFCVEFPYAQSFDLQSFKGRVFSSSYTPTPADNGYSNFVEKLENLFSKYSQSGSVSFEYSTTVYSGHMRRQRGH
jgi:SAM-dependent methyltransferase